MASSSKSAPAWAWQPHPPTGSRYTRPLAPQMLACTRSRRTAAVTSEAYRPQSASNRLRHLSPRVQPAARRKIKRNNRNIVVLAKSLGSLRNVARRFVAHLLRAFKPEELTVNIGSLDNSIRKKYQPVANLQLKRCLLILDVGDHAQRKIGCQIHLAPITIRVQVPRIGNRHGAVRIDSRAEASGKAGRSLLRQSRFKSSARIGGRAQQNIVESIEHRRWIAR